ncbi:MAG: hypothetical protein MZV65_31340 [Chromatiales bacterium]|nr:hypothetical protein [Chromatiales bacterium]
MGCVARLCRDGAGRPAAGDDGPEMARTARRDPVGSARARGTQAAPVPVTLGETDQVDDRSRASAVPDDGKPRRRGPTCANEDSVSR